MASVPQAQGLPLLYNDLVPLSKLDHAAYKVKGHDDFRILSNVHAIPLTTDEFSVAMRFYPIIFSAGPDSVPLALMGLNEGVNVFVDEASQISPANTYLPAYLRRYPYMLARLNPQSDEMSLCFDPQSGLVGEYDDGVALFENGEQTQQVTDTLQFCEQFEMGAQRTSQFMKDLIESGLLEEGEVTIQHPNVANPYIYRGFQMVNEEKLRELRGDQLRKMNQNGMLVLLHAHLFSLNLMTEIFNRQMEQGKVPPQVQLT
jgi:hypothetical protein